MGLGLGMAIAGLGKLAGKAIKKHGEKVAGDAVSTAGRVGLGMGLARWGQNRQVDQAERLQDVQMGGMQQMGKFNQGLALETAEMAPSAQRAGLEKAGLNVGLMYGGSGAGGVTAQPGQVQGQAAGGADVMQGLGMIQGMGLNQAQIDLIKAQKDKTNVETAKAAGVETELIKQQARNLMAQEEGLLSDSEVSMRTVTPRVRQAWADSWIAMRNKDLIEEYGDKQAQANLALTQAQKEKANQEIWAIGEKVGQDWEKLSQTERETIVKERMADFGTSTPEQIKQWTSIITDIMKAAK